MSALLLFAEYQIDNPTTPDVFAGVTAVVEDVVVVAPGILKCVSEDRHRGELASVVHLLGESNGGVSAPFIRERDWSERVAQNATDHSRMFKRKHAMLSVV
jgi:hypothetical protein